MKSFVITYDISNPKRAQKLQRLVSNKLIQLQYSVYYGKLTTEAVDILISQIKSIIHTTDDVRVFEIEPLENACIRAKSNTTKNRGVSLFSEHGQLFI